MARHLAHTLAARLLPLLALLMAATATATATARGDRLSPPRKETATPPPLPPPPPPPPRPSGAQLPLPLALHSQRPNAQQQQLHPHPQPYSPRPRLAHLGNLISQLEDARTAPPFSDSTPTEHAVQSHPGSSYDSSDYYEDEDDDDDYDFEDDYSDMDDIDMDKHVLQLPQSHQPRGMSPVSQTKWDTMGTRSSVEELRRSRIAAGASKTLSAMTGYTEAVDHLLRVNRDGDCKVPKPRVVQVKHEYPHPSKIYLPRCTILHQCGDDTGCCSAESLTCVPRQTHRVDLFFYTSTVGTAGPSSLQRVERLSFYNHTECGCVDRNSELLSRDRAQALRKNSRGLFQVALQQRAERAPQLLMSCHCPSKYAVRPTADGSCICDCFDKHRECLRLKKGKEYFSTHDRQCIQKSECKVPACEFGSYLRLAGRCPKKRERFEAWNQ